MVLPGGITKPLARKRQQGYFRSHRRSDRGLRSYRRLNRNPCSQPRETPHIVAPCPQRRPNFPCRLARSRHPSGRPHHRSNLTVTSGAEPRRRRRSGCHSRPTLWTSTASCSAQRPQLFTGNGRPAGVHLDTRMAIIRGFRYPGRSSTSAA